MTKTKQELLTSLVWVTSLAAMLVAGIIAVRDTGCPRHTGHITTSLSWLGVSLFWLGVFLALHKSKKMPLLLQLFLATLSAAAFLVVSVVMTLLLQPGGLLRCWVF